MMCRIVIYADEYKEKDWREYCYICGVPDTAKEITIVFDDKNISYR